jgi:hypothetical protein
MSRTSWHPAFFGAIQKELDEYRNVLEFKSEYQLISEPLKIDVVIIKKRRNMVIKKNIAGIFRHHNIIEYKSPNVSVAIKDYSKTQGCSWLYSSFNDIDIKDVSVTMVVTQHPYKLLNYLKERFGLSTIQKGIYFVNDMNVPTQIVVSSELSEEENIWITGLNQNLDGDRLKQVTNQAVLYQDDPAVAAYLDAVIGANFQTYKKLQGTQDMKTLTQHLKEAGILDQLIAEKQTEMEAKWQAEKIERARELKHRGMDYETIMIATGLSPTEVKRLK